MAINENIKDLKFFKPSKGGKYTIDVLPFDGKDNFIKLPIHWQQRPLKDGKFHVICNPKTTCPICELLKPKTRWQKIKERISKLWKLLNR